MIKRILSLCMALLAAAGASAQQDARIGRTEAAPYDMRHDAEARNLAASGHTLAFRPETTITAEGPLCAVMEQQTEIPYVWTDGCVYLHIENAPTAYALWVNDRSVAEVDDPLTPAEFDLSPYIRQGANDFKLLMFNDRGRLDASDPVRRKEFEGSYLYYQNKRSIRDFRIALVPDSLGRNFAMLDLQIVAQNMFNYDEKVEVGYDIYSPQGKLLEFDIRETVIPGRSADTVRFSPFIYHAYENKWEPSAKNPPLYKVMLFTRRDGTYKEYMPLKIGFGPAEFADGRFTRFGKPLQLNIARYNAAADAKTTAAQLQTLRKQGYNTLAPDYPQPEWFYGLCDQLGLQVIDRANIHAPEQRDNRRVGGTPSNDPALADEYLKRVQAMYYRSRNHTCVIAYALGGEAGNGYCMYKAYQWLKEAEPSRPVICADADGEWNTDL
ncbi:glycoside hydrolase family 2 TIM barrel-domain containing protein [uncultured Alistipes sp.]|uniref:glycoside hydrolase family 2 TIM barrel-domain containing protein n=1 Tax=uncultured Alistipes sp. TaxID=538949 RepID=UPI00321F6557